MVDARVGVQESMNLSFRLSRRTVCLHFEGFAHGQEG
jgi:hypothetical protein